MPTRRRARLTALAVLVVLAAALPAVVLAAPKGGYYIDPEVQVYVIVSGDSTHVKSFQVPCLVAPEGGGAPSQQGGYVLKKKLKISKKGKFSYSGKVKLQSLSTTRVKIKIAGKFKGGKAKGTVTFPDKDTGCEKTKFSGKYYGKHPQG
jgi:hypothetical protein